MGYEVRVTRTDELAEVVEETPILPQEFYAVIATMPTKAETLRWMVIAARRLDAYVRGDDGEEYDLDENGVVLVDGGPRPSR